ncbi:pentapeptide repeat-containing protein [Actinomadura coerulea]|uniref:pentapeptide repeat-containing protein n=1 Tax=Actinomadura coerulea TaxID=46159 RepID=UPI0034266D7E
MAEPSQIPEPTLDELNEIPADRRLELLELRRQRQDAERDRRRQSKHQWFNSVGIVIGVMAAVAGLITTAVTWRIGQDELRTTREGQVTDRYAKAVEQLGSGRREVRTAAVYALERIARDSERDRSAIVDVLAAFTREHDPAPKIKTAALPPEPDTDVAAALTVLGRLPRPHRTPPGTSTLDLHDIRVPRSRLSLADLHDADLPATKLSDASLRGADLASADLRDAFLGGADLGGANLLGADLRGANLRNIKGKSVADVSRAARTDATTRF